MEISTISDIQEYIHQSIHTVGGYWPPLSAVARLLEEIGELSYELSNAENEADLVKYELADIFILTVCIANQYSAHLQGEYEELGLKINSYKNTTAKIKRKQIDQALPVLLEINMGAGMIARIINAYEGSKIPKQGEGLKTVAEAIVDLQRSLISFADIFRIDILKISRSVFDRKSRRDKKRFDQLFDPTLSNALLNFKTLQGNTFCVYASQAKLWGSSKYDELKDFDENMFILVPQLVRFTRIAPSEHIDGFIIEFPTPDFGDNIENLAKTMNKFLRYLNKYDPKESRCLNANVEGKRWQFNFNGLDLFVIAFAPFYPQTNGRHSGSDKTFFFVQPQIMFKKKIQRHKISEVKQLIRENFSNNGQSYDGHIMQNDIESHKFVKPLQKNDPPIRWWEYEH